jgi:iron complex transport system substrate-binding protein
LGGQGRIFVVLFFILRVPEVLGQVLFDSTKVRVQVPDYPKRIVALTPALAELSADFLGDQLDRLVGVAEWSEFPAALKKIESIGPYHQFNLEKVVALKPDLILASTDGNPKERVLHLRELGLPVLVTQSDTLAEIEDSLLLVAQSLGKFELGRQRVKQFRLGLQKLTQAAQHRSHPRVLLQLGAEPLIAVGGRSFLNDCLQRLGAENIYGDLDVPYPRPSFEDAAIRNPEVILLISVKEDPRKYDEMKKKWDRFKSVSAVKKGKVSIFNSDELLRPGSRVLSGLFKLDQAIFGQESDVEQKTK